MNIVKKWKVYLAGNLKYKCKDNFNKLKELLTTAPILKIADLDKYFIICTDACNEGLGRVLTQEGHAIAYQSRK